MQETELDEGREILRQYNQWKTKISQDSHAAIFNAIREVFLTTPGLKRLAFAKLHRSGRFYLYRGDERELTREDLFAYTPPYTCHLQDFFDINRDKKFKNSHNRDVSDFSNIEKYRDVLEELCNLYVVDVHQPHNIIFISSTTGIRLDLNVVYTSYFDPN